ncbi:MAG: hypothetical protein KKC14_15990 [Alphaproteobacteria bacterium]|nr:hypothetical protein [Alphaproteobacteria bacterium]
MTSFLIIMTCGVFALAATVGVIDLFVHLICWSARSLRTPAALGDRRDEVVQGSAQGMTA